MLVSRTPIFAAAALLALVPAGIARACPCGTGDPTLSRAVASEAPRTDGAATPATFRLGGELRLMLDAYGAVGVDRAEVVDVRLETSLTVTPIDGLSFLLLVPVAYREVTRANLSREQIFALADPELRVRGRLLATGAPDVGRHELDAFAGIDFPIMPDVARPDGTPISMEAMVASGSFDPLVGLLYRFQQDPFALGLALTWRFPTPGYAQMTMGPSFDAALLLGGSVIDVLQLRGAIESRHELAAQMPDGPMPNTGGTLLRIGGDVVLTPMRGLSIAVGMRGPVLDAMNGDRDPGITASALVMGEVSP